ncbi:hypothetical protein O3P69_001063 [Scylla paramamosain]|uniref:RRM domain-containing protein n=1 Tax=Scylla paramamosain TaxID=85552 RepID=A0AAW0UQE6_SCYPA
MSKVGNQTNSQDPQAINSRTFVGNLNTFQCTKTDVERMFQRYGRIAGEYPGREPGVTAPCSWLGAGLGTCDAVVRCGRSGTEVMRDKCCTVVR